MRKSLTDEGSGIGGVRQRKGLTKEGSDRGRVRQKKGQTKEGSDRGIHEHNNKDRSRLR